MRHACSVPVLLAFAALAGYAAAARPVQAQSDQWPFGSGDAIVLAFPGGGTRSCTIAEMKGTFARCETDQPQTLRIGQRERPEEWVNMAQVEWVTRPRAEK